MTLVAEESAKSKAAKEVIKSLTAQVILFDTILLFLGSTSIFFFLIVVACLFCV
jgi:hypothetical protein